MQTSVLFIKLKLKCIWYMMNMVACVWQLDWCKITSSWTYLSFRGSSSLLNLVSDSREAQQIHIKEKTSRILSHLESLFGVDEPERLIYVYLPHTFTTNGGIDGSLAGKVVGLTLKTGVAILFGK